MDYALYGEGHLRYDADPFQLRLLSTTLKLRCPKCEETVFFVRRRNGQNHFKHKAGVGTEACELFHPSQSLHPSPPSPPNQYRRNSQIPRVYPDGSIDFSLVFKEKVNDRPAIFMHLEWNKISDGDSLEIKVFGDQIVRVTASEFKISKTYFVDLESFKIFPGENCSNIVEEVSSYINSFIGEHRYFILYRSNRLFSPINDSFVLEEMVGVYDSVDSRIVYNNQFPSEEFLLSLLVEDGYERMFYQAPVRVTSPDAININPDVPIMSCRSLKRIVLTNSKETSIAVCVEYFWGYKRAISRIFELGSGRSVHDFSHNGCDKILIRIGNRVYTVVLEQRNIFFESNNLYSFCQKGIPFLLDLGGFTLKVEKENHTWKILENLPETEGFDNIVHSKKSWNKNILGY